MSRDRPVGSGGPEGQDEEPPAEEIGERPPEDGGEAPAPATWAGRRRQEEAAEPDTEEHAAAADEADPEQAEAASDEAEEATEDAEPPEEGEDSADAAAEPTEDADEPEPTAAAPTDETVEADTLALGDREAAREAAREGLRARTAEHAAKLERAKSGGEAEPEAPPAEEARSQPPPAGPAAPAAPAGAAVEEEPKRRGLGVRFVAASLLIIVSMATATSVSLLVYLTDIARGLGGIRGVENKLTAVGGGDPQTILILGSDKRLDSQGDPGRSDTTILLRVDPDRKAIALLSIPRDLRVNIPGVGVGKFNEAYTAGGPQLTLEVVKQLTGIDVNHVVNINFTGFADAVNAIGCVYIDVDRRYYVPPEADFAEIDIEAGYQRLCGLKALQYVRYRHEDNDLVRSARQQDFLREARQRIPPSTLFEDRHQLLAIFQKYTTSDNALKDPVEVLELLKTFIGVRNVPVAEVHFPADLGDGTSGYVETTKSAIEGAIDQFLGTEGTPGPPGDEEDPDGSEKNDGEGGDKPAPEPQPEPAVETIDSTADGQLYANAVADKKLDMPVMYPTRLIPGSLLSDASRSFPIDGPGDEVYRGYKLVASLAADTIGYTAYYGLSGTTWKDPPILENPSEERTIDGRTYQLYYDGDRLRLVAWKTDQGSYWVNNTLGQLLGEDQMLAVATSARELGG